MSSLVLWGAGGHGKVVLDAARAMGAFGNICFVDDAWDGHRGQFCQCEVFEVEQYLQLHRENGARYLVSIGNNSTRAACFQKLFDFGLVPATIAHPTAVVSGSARIEDGTVIMARVVINAEAEIGRNCILNTAAVIEHDCRVGDHVHVSPGVVLGGGVRVHSFAHLGIGAIALPGAEIGEGATVGAGAVVLGSVSPGATVIGIPARVLSKTGGQINL